jgi:hypothetical protein
VGEARRSRMREAWRSGGVEERRCGGAEAWRWRSRGVDVGAAEARRPGGVEALPAVGARPKASAQQTCRRSRASEVKSARRDVMPWRQVFSAAGRHSVPVLPMMDVGVTVMTIGRRRRHVAMRSMHALVDGVSRTGVQRRRT